jgi:predicted HicB family RNase H-like nuclease
MSTISLRLPESLHNTARKLAERENISINQLITLALAEKISAW